MASARKTTPETYMEAEMRTDEEIRLIVASRMLKDRKTKVQIATEIGMSKYLFWQRMAAPHNFTLTEFRRLAEVLDMTEAERKRCLF